jgi:type II secretory pathway pseudopilin PulG
MTRFPGSGVPRRLHEWMARRAQSARDGGFILLESVIAIAVITVIMGAVGAEFVSSVASTTEQRYQQVAVQLGDSAVEQIRALHASDLLLRRDQASVTAQFAAAPTAVKPWLASMDQVWDTTPNLPANSGATAAIPTAAVTQKPGTIAYTINEYLGACSIRATGSSDCVPTSSLTAGTAAVPYVRAVVAVTWNGTRCGSSSCAYVTSTLVSTTADRTWRINAAPYSAPVIVSPGNLVYAVSDTVSQQLTMQNGTGVPPFTWAVSAGTLPGGLGLSPTGLISGTVTGAPGSYSVTIQGTDAFLRSDTQTISITVEPALVLTSPGPQATTTAQTVSLQLAATGGDGAPYTYADTGSTLPPGLTMTVGGLITGRPTASANYAVQIAVTDSSGSRSSTGTFTWTVTAPPLAASNPGPLESTVSTAITPLQLSASGGKGNYVWTDASPRSLPAGLSLSSTGLLTGTPGATGTSTVVLTVNDGSASKSVTFTWTVDPRPTVTAPATQNSSVGAAINLQLTTGCTDDPCVYTFGGTPPSGLAISSTGKITGTVGTTVKPFTGITITVTDAAGATATTAAFSWTVNAAPTMASPGNQTTKRGAAVSLDISGLDSGGTGTMTFSASGLPSWLTLNASTGKITGTAPSGANSTTTGIKIGVTDASGVSASSTAFTWNVTDLASSFADQNSHDATAVSVDLDNFSTGGTGPYTYLASGLPSWLSLNSTTGVISGTSPNLTNASTKTSGISITVTDSKGATITVTGVNWYNSDLTSSLPSTVTTSQGQNMSGYSAASYISGGSSTRTYAVTGLPTGLTMTSAGAVSGSTTTRGTYNTTFVVTDSVGATLRTSVVWTVQ